MFYGIIGIAFALAEAVPRGFDLFGRIIRAGDFDRILLRPRSAALQIMGMELQLMRIGRLSQAVAVLIWASAAIDITWTAPKLGLLIFAILGGASLFSGLFILQATLCFWTVESIEIVNCTTYGGVEAAQFPLTIYRPWFRHIFVWVIPLATINYLPAHAILGRAETVLGAPLWAQWLAPLVGVAFLLVCLQAFHLGVKRYTSTGS
jgi:ABC-2 type transport system permease protein